MYTWIVKLIAHRIKKLSEPNSAFCGVVGWTDGQTDGQKATPKSPPCMSTGGLKQVRWIHPESLTFPKFPNFGPP